MVSELSVPRPVGSLATVHKNATMALEDRSPLFSDLKKLIVEAFGTPWWISKLSAMANEVRERTMLVVVHSHIQPINDIAIYHAISEIGLIEDVRYLPVVSGFHSRLRFCSKTDVDWVYHYYNGMYLPEGCCKLEILRANEVISWNLQKLAEIKERYKIDDSSKVTSEDHLSGMKLKSDEAVIEMKESTQLEVKDKSKSAQEPFGWVAHQVLDEMLKPQTDLKASKVSDLSDARPLSVVYKEFTDLTKGLDELPVQDDVSFDPGGKSNVVLKDNSDVLDDGDALTVKGLIFDGFLTMGEESVQMEITEKLEVEKGTLQLDVHYMFHEMSEWKISSEIKLGMPLLSRASSFVVVMNPPHHVAQGSGSTELIFTLQKWLLMGAWVDANPDDEMLPFDPGGTRLTPLAYKIDHKAMLVSPTEEQDNFKPFNASELIQNIMYKLFADKLDCMKEGAFDPGGEERDMTDVLTMTLLVIDGSTNGQLSKAVLKIDEIVKGDGEMVPMELTNELIQMGELLDSNGYQLLDTFSKSASINKHEPTEKEEVQLEKHVTGTNTSLLMEFDKCIGSWVAKDDGIEMPIFDPGGEPMFTNGNSLHLNFILQRKISLWSAEKNNVQKFKEQKCSEVLNVDISMLVFYPELSLTAVGVSDMLELKSFEEAFKMKGFFLTTPDRFSNFKKWKFAAEFTTEVRQVINRYVDFHMMSKTEFLSLAELQRLLSFVYGGVQAESSDVLLISNSGLWNLFDYDGHIWNGPVESKLQSESFSCLGSNLQEGSLRGTSLVSIYGENGRLSLFFKCSYCDFQLLVFDPCIALMEERKSGTKMALIFCRTNVCKFFFELSFMDKGLNDNLQLQSEEAKKNLHHSFPICVDMRDERHFLFNSGIVEGILGALTTTNSLNYDAANANIKSFEKCNHFPMTAGFLTDSEFQQLKLTRDEYLMQIIHSIHVHELGVDTCMVEISLIRCKSWTDVNGDDVNMLSEIPLLRVKPLIDTKESMVIEDFTLGCKRFLFRDHADFLSNEDCYAYLVGVVGLFVPRALVLLSNMLISAIEETQLLLGYTMMLLVVLKIHSAVLSLCVNPTFENFKIFPPWRKLEDKFHIEFDCVRGCSRYVQVADLVNHKIAHHDHGSLAKFSYVVLCKNYLGISRIYHPIGAEYLLIFVVSLKVAPRIARGLMKARNGILVFDLGGGCSKLTNKDQRARFVSKIFKKRCSLTCYATKVMMKWKIHPSKDATRLSSLRTRMFRRGSIVTGQKMARSYIYYYLFWSSDVISGSCLLLLIKPGSRLCFVKPYEFPLRTLAL